MGCVLVLFVFLDFVMNMSMLIIASASAATSECSESAIVALVIAGIELFRTFDKLMKLLDRGMEWVREYRITCLVLIWKVVYIIAAGVSVALLNLGCGPTCAYMRAALVAALVLYSAVLIATIYVSKPESKVEGPPSEMV